MAEQRFIDAETLLKKISKMIDCCEKDKKVNGLAALFQVGDAIMDCPIADVVEVVHGWWDDSGRYTFPNGAAVVRCTNCGCALTESEYRLNNWNYCPVCGATMDGHTEGRT